MERLILCLQCSASGAKTNETASQEEAERVMGNSREIEVGGKHLIIHEHEMDGPHFSDLDRAGASLWDCAITLAHYLPIYALSHPLSSKSVLELGAGTGLPGLVAAALGSARVTLTDRPHLLPGLRRNVDANSAALSSPVRVLPLEWGSEEQLAALGDDRPFDQVLLSDLLYDVAAMPDLCRTLKGVSDGRTKMLLAYELRAGTTDCFRVLREEGFGWRKVGKEELHPVWQSEDIGIFNLWRM
ncbi:Patched [Asimina triloba]